MLIFSALSSGDLFHIFILKRNIFSHEFIDMFCESDGSINWEKVIKFNSGKD